MVMNNETRTYNNRHHHPHPSSRFFFKVRYAKVPQQFAPSQSPREVAVHDSGNEISVVNTLQYLLGPRLLKVKSKHHFEVERLLIS